MKSRHSIIARHVAILFYFILFYLLLFEVNAAPVPNTLSRLYLDCLLKICLLSSDSISILVLKFGSCFPLSI